MPSATSSSQWKSVVASLVARLERSLHTPARRDGSCVCLKAPREGKGRREGGDAMFLSHARCKTQRSAWPPPPRAGRRTRLQQRGDELALLGDQAEQREPRQLELRLRDPKRRDEDGQQAGAAQELRAARAHAQVEHEVQRDLAQLLAVGDQLHERTTQLRRAELAREALG
eukprot:4235861-Prymnesium_polylepis.2